MRNIHIKADQFTVIELIQSEIRKWVAVSGAEQKVKILELELGSRQRLNEEPHAYDTDVKFVVGEVVVLLEAQVFDEGRGRLPSKDLVDAPFAERLHFEPTRFMFPDCDQATLAPGCWSEMRRGLRRYFGEGATQSLLIRLGQ